MPTSVNDASCTPIEDVTLCLSRIAGARGGADKEATAFSQSPYSNAPVRARQYGTTPIVKPPRQPFIRSGPGRPALLYFRPIFPRAREFGARGFVERAMLGMRQIASATATRPRPLVVVTLLA